MTCYRVSTKCSHTMHLLSKQHARSAEDRAAKATHVHDHVTLAQSLQVAFAELRSIFIPLSVITPLAARAKNRNLGIETGPRSHSTSCKRSSRMARYRSPTVRVLSSSSASLDIALTGPWLGGNLYPQWQRYQHRHSLPSMPDG